MADEFDWSTDPTYSDYGGTPDTTSYNSDGTTNEGGTGYSFDLNSGSDSGIGGLFSGTDLAKLFAGSPLLKTLGAAGLGKLADKLFDVQKGAGGYKGGIPELVSSRQMLPIPRTMQDASGRTVARRPGAGGVSYFTPNQYITPAQAAAAKAEQPLVQLPQQSPGQQVSRDDLFYQSPEFQAYQKSQDGMMGTMDMYNSPYFGQLGSGSSGRAMDAAYEKYRQSANAPVQANYAAGGITTLGGYSDGGRLLKGPGDGVSDSIPAVIGKKQPARLADGEFVIPARIVSELGNGSTEAGARKLYAMMDRIKKARSKAKNIAADTKSDKHLPA
jgi:hypothetical protein